jgi:hypothetical protein
LQRELLAIALLALSVLLLLSFVPVAALGPSGQELFSDGNVVGTAGRWISGGSRAILGLPAILLPFLPAIWAVAVLGRLGRSAAIRLTCLVIGIMILVPAATYAFARPDVMAPPAAGWIGAALGAPMVTALGWLGAGILLVFLFVALCVVTLGWNPLRSLAGGSAAAWTGFAGFAGALPGRLRRALP